MEACNEEGWVVNNRKKGTKEGTVPHMFSLGPQQSRDVLVKAASAAEGPGTAETSLLCPCLGHQCWPLIFLRVDNQLRQWGEGMCHVSWASILYAWPAGGSQLRTAASQPSHTVTGKCFQLVLPWSLHLCIRCTSE